MKIKNIWNHHLVTPRKINMEQNNEGLVQIIFLSKWMICRFQPFIFQGVKVSHSLSPLMKIHPPPFGTSAAAVARRPPVLAGLRRAPRRSPGIQNNPIGSMDGGAPCCTPELGADFSIYKYTYIIYIYILYLQWPLFLKVNPPIQSLLQSKQGSSKGSRYIYIYNS